MATALQVIDGVTVVGGFLPASTEIVPRLIAAISGHERTGKTDLALTAPEPVWYMSLDRGGNDIVAKFARSKTIHVKRFVMPRREKPVTKREEGTAVSLVWVPIWEELKAEISAVLANNEGTLIVDTLSEMYVIHRLAAFGRLSGVRGREYDDINTELRQLMWDIADSAMNVIFIQKMKKEYKALPGQEGQWTGGFEPAGYTGFGYEVDCNIRTTSAPSPAGGGVDFTVQVLDSRQNPAAVGTYPRKTIIPVEGQSPLEVSWDFKTLLGIVYN
jgi:hypothetical protein